MIYFFKIFRGLFKIESNRSLIFGNIEFWHPIRAEGRQNLTEYRIDLKMVSKRPQRILMNLQLLFESVLIAIFVTNSVNMQGGHYVPPPLFRVKHCRQCCDYFSPRRCCQGINIMIKNSVKTHSWEIPQ
jgi:hypothetical protein